MVWYAIMIVAVKILGLHDDDDDWWKYRWYGQSDGNDDDNRKTYCGGKDMLHDTLKQQLQNINEKVFNVR